VSGADLKTGEITGELELIDEMLEFSISLSCAEKIAPVLLPLMGDPEKLQLCYLELAHHFPHLRFDRAAVMKNLH
jgi:hypothetical protein